MLIIAFIVAILLIAVLDAAIVYDFLRYRYTHDRVPVILFLFVVCTVLTIIFTTTLLVTGAPGASSVASLTVN